MVDNDPLALRASDGAATLTNQLREAYEHGDLQPTQRSEAGLLLTTPRP